MTRLNKPAEAAEIIDRFQRILVVAHEKPDGDALGAALGLAQILRDNGKQADALLPDPIPAKFEAIAGADFLTALDGATLRNDYDLVVALDCANSARLALGTQLDIAALGTPLLNVDHHVDNSVDADWSLVDGKAAATAQLVYEIAESMPVWTISARAATLLLVGLITDTGAFRFSNTSGAALRAAAGLREHGADWERVVNAAFFSKPLRQQQFETEMLHSCVKSACEGHFLYAAIPDELFAKYDFDMRDGESIIDLLREIDGVVIAALIYKRNGQFKVSLRSKDLHFPVGPIARQFNGGGHQMAAGATITAPTLADAEAQLLAAVTKTLESVTFYAI